MAIAIRIGREHGEHIRVDVAGWEHPDATDFDDGNWLLSQVWVKAGAFSGRFGTSLRSEEFARFLGAVRRLRDTLKGQAVFETLEGQLRVELAQSGSLGGLDVTAMARDRAGTGNCLEFQLADFDQTDLGPLIADLEELTGTFPVRARPALMLYKSSPQSRRGANDPLGWWRFSVLRDGALVDGQLTETPIGGDVDSAIAEMQGILETAFAIRVTPNWEPSPGRDGWWQATMESGRPQETP